ncbi:MAG TPA: DUF6457 domain-containing protein [Gaiellaceae bacterium]|jgi:hypothetical protein|nr:DUF6457 domain-containing protein [Gaiellaceae bacterium]
MQPGHKRPDHTTHERTEELENSAADALDTWITELAAALEVDAATIDHNQILELSRATHRVARAAAPFTLLLVGIAAGQDGVGAEAVNQAVATAQRLATTHAPEPTD